MKKGLFLLLFISGFIFGQNGFYQLDFESNGGYTTSISEFTDGSADYFIRSDGSNLASSVEFTEQQGSYFFTAQDIDGEGAGLPASLDITGIDITGNSGLVLSLLLAEDVANDGNVDWDASDYIHISCNIDGAGWQNLLWIEMDENNGVGTNGRTLIDTDFDGIGDGIEITSEFTEFTSTIPGIGTSIDIKIEFNLNGGDEDIALDNIRIGSDQTPLPVELTTFTVFVSDQNVVVAWETATEVNNYGFDVERRIENTDWQQISFVNGHGNSNSPKYYSYTDSKIEASGTVFYRLKQIDIDGKFEYADAIEVNLGTPNKIELSQNYPNPFNPVTSIKLNLPQDSQVRLSVFNILGQEVAELINDKIIAGYHSVNFNASQVNSGIYFYKLESNNFVQIRKMMLIK